MQIIMGFKFDFINNILSFSITMRNIQHNNCTIKPGANMQVFSGNACHRCDVTQSNDSFRSHHWHIFGTYTLLSAKYHYGVKM